VVNDETLHSSIGRGQTEGMGSFRQRSTHSHFSPVQKEEKRENYATPLNDEQFLLLLPEVLGESF